MMKKVLKSYPRLYRLTKIVVDAVKGKMDKPEYWVSRLLSNKEVVFVQVGSNDGLTNDPFSAIVLRNKKWHAYFIEPVPYLFEKLKKNYGEKDRFTFINAAVNEGKEQPFYWISEESMQEYPELPSWSDQVGSFDRSHIEKNLDGKLIPFIKETLITGLSFTQLQSTYKIDKINLLHIDTEGYDWKILSQVKLDEKSPEIILFEHMHLSTEERAEAITTLSPHYYIYVFQGDYLCLNKLKLSLSDAMLTALSHKRIQH